MGIVYWVLWILEALWIVLWETIDILQNLQNTNILARGENFTTGLCI